MTDVSKQSTVQETQARIVRPIRTLVAGTAAMRKAREEFLPKEPMETAGSYDNRIRRSVLFNATGKTVDDLTGRVFTKPIALAKDVPQQIKDWAENIDNAGRHLNVFARDVFHNSLQSGIGYIYVDMPPAVQREDGKPPTIDDEQKAGIRPYLKFIPLENLLGFKSAVIGGVETLTQIRVKECVTKPDPNNEFLDIDVDQVRVVTRGDGVGGCTWQTFQQQTGNDGTKWAQADTGTISLPEIPLVTVYLNRSEFMQAKPPLEKLAELNIAHWQLDSDVSNIMHVANVPILFGAGFSDETQIAVGASSMVRSSDANSKLTYVEHTGAAIGKAQERLQTLVTQMQAMGLQLVINQPNQSKQTATGVIADDAKETSPLAMMATSLQDALEAALDLMAQFAGIADTDNENTDSEGGSVIVNKDFGINGNRFDLQFLTQAVIAGKISNETYWTELQRRGVLGDEFDPEVEATRIAEEAPALDAGPGNGMDLNAGPN